jgi:hypothetical protein
MWLAVEAKSEQTADRLSMDYVRKANTQLDSLAADKGVDQAPQMSATVIVAQNRLVDPDAVPIANPNVYLTTTELVLDIAHGAHRAWNDLRGSLIGVPVIQARVAAAETLWAHRVVPTQVRERLTHEPIKGS